MILTEAHTFQIASILIEAAEEQGEKKESLFKKIKNMLSRALNWIKEKLSSFKAFLSDKVSKLGKAIKSFVAKFSSKEVKDKAKEADKEGPVEVDEDNIKNILETLGSSMLRVLNATENIAGAAGKVNVQDITEIDKDLTILEKLLEEYTEAVKDVKEFKDEDIGKAADMMKKPATKLVDEATKALTDLAKIYVKATEGNKKVEKAISNSLETLKSLDKMFNPSLEEGPKPTLISRLISRMTGLVSRVSSGISLIWGSIATCFKKIVKRVSKAINIKYAGEEPTVA